MIRITHELIGFTPSTQVDEMTVATDASYTTARDSTIDGQVPGGGVGDGHGVSLG